MAWIRQERVGLLRALLAGLANLTLVRTVVVNLWRSYIMKSMSINLRAMYAVSNMTRAVTFGASPLTRVQEEAIAVAVSAANKCRF